MVSSHVGTLGEKPLHASLKEWYRRPEDQVEVPVAGYLIDLVRGDLLIEIQTGSFSKMRSKLKALLVDHEIRIVHPVATDRWIVRMGNGGEVLGRRKSPRHGSYVDLFGELVAFPELITSPNLTVEVVLTHEDELRRHDPDRAWRRKGWVVEERHLIEVVDHRVFETAAELADLLGDTPDRFTTRDISSATGCRMRTAQQMAYCLRKAGAITLVGKDGNALVYVRSGAALS